MEALAAAAATTTKKLNTNKVRDTPRSNEKYAKQVSFLEMDGWVLTHRHKIQIIMKEKSVRPERQMERKTP